MKLTLKNTTNQQSEFVDQYRLSDQSFAIDDELLTPGSMKEIEPQHKDRIEREHAHLFRVGALRWAKEDEAKKDEKKPSSKPGDKKQQPGKKEDDTSTKAEDQDVEEPKDEAPEASPGNPRPEGSPRTKDFSSPERTSDADHKDERVDTATADWGFSKE